MHRYSAGLQCKPGVHVPFLLQCLVLSVILFLCFSSFSVNSECDSAMCSEAGEHKGQL